MYSYYRRERQLSQSVSGPSGIHEASDTKSASRKMAISSFVLGLSAFIFVPVGGRLSIAELLIVFIFVTTFSHGSYYSKMVRWLILSLVVLVLGLVLSGVAFGVEHEKFIQVIANYSVLVLSVVVLAAKIRASLGACIPYLFSGAAIGQLVGFVVSPTIAAQIDPWKFSVGWAVTVLVLLGVRRLDQMPSGTALIVLVVAFLVAANFVAGSRSTAILVAVCGFFFFRSRLPSMSRNNLRIVFFGVVGFITATLLYQYTASVGVWGAEVQEKLRAQSGSFGILFGARKELMLLINSWLASPVIGWGPAAAVPIDVRSSTYTWYASNGYEMNYSDLLRLFGVEAVPLHSVIFGSLVQAGIFALGFCVVLTFGIYLAVRNGFREHDMATLFIALSGGVHIVTSPLGDSTRFPVALCLAIGLGLSAASPPKTRQLS